MLVNRKYASYWLEIPGIPKFIVSLLKGALIFESRRMIFVWTWEISSRISVAYVQYGSGSWLL